MSYNISSENFSNPLLKELLEKLTGFFDSIESEFYVIGATARDMIIFILKLNAWSSRNIETNRDADDMAFIISSYLGINEQRAVDENYDLYENDDFTTFNAGTALLGRDMKAILKANAEILNEFAGILRTETDQMEDSKLINQIMETHASLKYEEVYNGLLSITNELNK